MTKYTNKCNFWFFIILFYIKCKLFVIQFKKIGNFETQKL